MSKKKEERQKMPFLQDLSEFSVLMCDVRLLNKVIAGGLSQKYLVTRSFSQGASSKSLFFLSFLSFFLSFFFFFGIYFGKRDRFILQMGKLRLQSHRHQAI